MKPKNDSFLCTVYKRWFRLAESSQIVYIFIPDARQQTHLGFDIQNSEQNPISEQTVLCKVLQVLQNIVFFRQSAMNTSADRINTHRQSQWWPVGSWPCHVVTTRDTRTGIRICRRFAARVQQTRQPSPPARRTPFADRCGHLASSGRAVGGRCT